MRIILELIFAVAAVLVLYRGVLSLALANRFVKASGATGFGAIGTALAHFVRQSISDTYLFSMTGLPLSVSSTTQSSKFVDMSLFDYVDFFVYIGANGTSVDAKVQESANANGGTPSDVSGGAITQIVTANQMAIISVKKSTLTKRYAGVIVTTVGVAVVAQAAVQYGEAGNLPVAQTAAGSNSYATAQVLKI